jgi:hypothetical protein
MRLRTFGIVTVLAMVAVLSFSGTAAADHDHHGHHGGRPLSAVLSGLNETPLVGDPDGWGTATLRLNPGHDEICFRIRVAGITFPATAANIYQGAAGISGAFVASLLPPTTTGSSEGCVAASHATVVAMIWNPSAYYVNVFNSDYLNGALRGQLAKGWGNGGGNGGTTTSQTFSANLKGANESPLVGDPDGSGSASITVSSTLNQICFDIHVSAIWLPAASAYLAQGPQGAAGPILASFTAPSVNGSSSGCVLGLTSGVISNIIANPSGYYVNVTTPDHPAGAIRGQLSGCDHGGGDDGDGGDDDVMSRNNSGGNGCHHGGGGGGGDND